VYVRDFRDTTLENRALAGSKGASLGELTRAGFNIPPGFTITTAAFERFIASIDGAGAIRRLITSLDPNELTALTATTAAVREQIEKAPLPKDVEQAILQAYALLAKGENIAVTGVSAHSGAAGLAPVAVRSSATSEDSAEASFGALQDTFLGVRGAESVIRSVRACWACLYSTASVRYRLRLKLQEQNVSMGVVVQRMVESACSGVMLTRSPTTGDRSVIAIEGSWGWGSCRASGEVTPDKFVVSKVTREITQCTVAEKRIQHVPQYDSTGVRVEAVSLERQSVPCLTDEQIVALAEIGKQIERHYGTPQEIEWAAGGGTIYIVQSRPVGDRPLQAHPRPAATEPAVH